VRAVTLLGTPVSLGAFGPLRLGLGRAELTCRIQVHQVSADFLHAGAGDARPSFVQRMTLMDGPLPMVPHHSPTERLAFQARRCPTLVSFFCERISVFECPILLP